VEGLEQLLTPELPAEEVLGAVARAPGMVGRLARAMRDRGELRAVADQHAMRTCEARWSPRTREGIVFDDRTLVVKWPDGRVLRLSRHRLLFRLVTGLAGQVGGATNEWLARHVWDVRQYSPQRDNKRIQVAINRLRRLLADQDLGAHLKTTPTGYEWDAAASSNGVAQK
jgi:DNA-binding response OmpR family regulator